MNSTREGLKNHIEDVLRESGSGLKADSVHERLGETYDVNASKRTIQQVLKEMVEDGRLDRQRRREGQGRPPYYYFIPEDDTGSRSAPVSYTDAEGEQATLFSYQDGVESATVKARGDMEPTGRDHEEAMLDFVDEVGRDVLADIAQSHRDESEYVQRITHVAPALEAESPVDLLTEMVYWTVRELNALGDEVRQRKERGDLEGFSEKVRELEQFCGWARRYFQGFWRLDPRGKEQEAMVDLPPAHSFYEADDIAEASVNISKNELRNHFNNRIIGESVIDILDVENNLEHGVGTDSSVADIAVRNENAFVPRTELSIFTAAAALETEDGQYTDFDFNPQRYEDYHDSEALERGLVLSSQTRHDLSEGELEHARPAALDLRQYMENLRVAMGDARWRPSGETTQPLVGIPRAEIVFGDGRLFPLVHHLNDFRQRNAYGRLVRNEIRRFFEQMKRAEDPDLGGIYASAVKHPRRTWLAPLVFWYINVKSDWADEDLEGVPKEVYRPRLTDEIISHLLFIGYEENEGGVDEDKMFVTFRALRAFADIALNTEEYPPVLKENGKQIDERDRDDWMAYFDEKRRRREEEFGKRPIPRDEYKSFAYLCANSGALMCYGAPCSLYLGQHDARMTLPRIEVACSVENPDDKNVKTAMSWFAQHHTGDMDHSRDDYSSVSEMPVLVPRVVEQAHEASTFVRKRMHQEVEDELRRFVADLS